MVLLYIGGKKVNHVARKQTLAYFEKKWTMLKHVILFGNEL